MKTERSYHSQNRFETKRRLLALPHKIIWLVWLVVAIVASRVIGASIVSATEISSYSDD